MVATEKANKSQMIRDLLAENPDMKVSDVVQVMAEKGLPIRASQVYVLRSENKPKRTNRIRHLIQPQQHHQVNPANSLELIRKLQELSSLAGGFKNVRRLIELMEGISN